MTISEMHIYWREKLDKSGSLNTYDFESEQIDFWINEAIRKYVKDRYLPKDEGFEQSEKRRSDLENIVYSQTLSCASSSEKPNSFVAYLSDLDEIHWLTVGEEVQISYVDCHGDSQTKRRGIVQTTEDTYRPMVDNAFGEHILENGSAKPLRLRRRKNVYFVTDGNYDVTEYYITYIKQPVEVNYELAVGCDLAAHTHDEIIDKSIGMVLAAMGDAEKYQLESVEESKHVD